MLISEPQQVRTVRDLLHEIRNSIAVILAHAHVVVSRPWIGSASAEALALICRESYRVVGLLNRVPQDLGDVAIDGRTALDPLSAADTSR